MEPSPPDRTGPTSVVVWDIPLRLWHWCFAGAVAGALGTGLSGDVTLMTWHQRCGWAALGLLLWRAGWGLWGSAAARWSSFGATLFRLKTGVRSLPGALLGLTLPFIVLLQASAGLFTSDFIFNEGPLARYASESVVDLMSGLHHRLYWVVIGLISLHLGAHLTYAWRRDAVVLGMFTGRKRLAVAPSQHHLVRAALWTALVAGFLTATIWAL